MDLLPVQKWCLVNGIPSDVVAYIVCGFYQPVMERYIGEKISIMKMRDYLSNTPKFWLIQLPRRMLSESLEHRLRTLERGVVDTRLGRYIQIIDIMVSEGVIGVEEVLHVLEAGIRGNNTTAFKVLYNTHMLFHFPCIDTFVRRASEKYSALLSWQVSDVDGMTPLVKYYLDKHTEEPLLEWLTIWHRKGLNVCKHVMDLTAAQQVQMQFLCKKQQSPEMRQRRMNSLRYNIYSDQVLCTI